MPTDQKQKATQNLHRALKIFGPDAHDTKVAAIECCHAHGLDPYYRYALWPKVSPELGLGLAVEGPLTIESVEEWQRMIGRARARS
jgi:hypothetical protein